MNRRDFLRSLAGLPLLGFLKPEKVESIRIKETPLSEELAGDTIVDLTPYFRYSGFIGDVPAIERWDGVGNHWKSTDGGRTWTQTAKVPSVYAASIQIRADGETWTDISPLLNEVEL